jgi:hypothetical protein
MFTQEVMYPHPNPPPSRGRELFGNIIISSPLAKGDIKLLFPLPWREEIKGRGNRIAQFR